MLSAQPWNQTLLIAMTEQIKKKHPNGAAEIQVEKPDTRDPLVASVLL